MGICKLCLQEKKLSKKSHIVPDYMYERIFENHRMIEFSVKENRWKKKKKPIQTSHHEPDLLCSDCDGVILSRLENYFKENLLIPVIKFSKKLPLPKDIEPGVFPADYNKIKLFFLSILWRYSISKRPENKNIVLEEHQGIIRKMIYENDPKGIHDYPFQLICFLNKENFYKNDPVTHISGNPLLNIRNQGLEYLIPFPGLFLFIRISSVRDDLFQSYIGSDKLLVGYAPEQRIGRLVNGWFRRIVKDIEGGNTNETKTTNDRKES